VLRKAIKNYDITIEIAPPGNHRTNLAERAIRTAKNHVVSSIATTDKNFPLELWDEIIPQAEITLNLMRGCRNNPVISAYEAVRGPYDLSKHPMAPAGMKVVVHEKPLQRGPWDPHGVEGYYLGPALEHYRCFRTWISHTNAQRISDTISWHPDKLRMPSTDMREELQRFGKDVNEALDNLAHNDPQAVQALKNTIQASIKVTSDQIKAINDVKIANLSKTNSNDTIAEAKDVIANTDNTESNQRVQQNSTTDDATKERVLPPQQESIQGVDLLDQSSTKTTLEVKHQSQYCKR